MSAALVLGLVGGLLVVAFLANRVFGLTRILALAAPDFQIARTKVKGRGRGRPRHRGSSISCRLTSLP